MSTIFLFSFQWVAYLIHHSMAKDNLKRNWLYHSVMGLFRGLLQFFLRCFSVREYSLWKASANYLGKSSLHLKLLDSRIPSILSLASKLRSCFKSPCWDSRNSALDFKSNPNEKDLRSMRGILELLTALNNQTLVSVVWNMQRLFSRVNRKKFFHFMEGMISHF